jgi:hypothetical protein
MTRVTVTGERRSFRRWSNTIDNQRDVTELPIAIRDDECGTDSDYVTYPTGPFLRLEFGRFRKRIRFMGRS